MFCYITLQDHGLDGSIANNAVMVECCKFVSTATFYWSIIYTRDVSGMSFAGNVPMSQNSLKISLLFSQFLAGTSSLFKRMLCTKLRVSSPLKFLPLQVLPHCQPIPALQVPLPWDWKCRLYTLLVAADYFFDVWKPDPLPGISHLA